VDRAFQKKTSELVQQHVGTDYIQPVTEVLEINEETVGYIVSRQGETARGTETRIQEIFS